MSGFANQSALLIPVPEAEAVVGEWRELYDPSAAFGVPAHITLLYPFVPAAQVDDALVRELGELVAKRRRFRLSFNRVGRFPSVLYLDPEPDVPVRRLMKALFAAYPDYPPYGGVHDEVIPHLTVIDRSHDRSDLVLLNRAAKGLAPQLPIEASVREVWLMTCKRRRWKKTAVFPLSR